MLCMGSKENVLELERYMEPGQKQVMNTKKVYRRIRGNHFYPYYLPRALRAILMMALLNDVFTASTKQSGKYNSSLSVFLFVCMSVPSVCLST